MPFYHGKSSQFTLDNAAGSVVDLSSYCDNTDFSQILETAETTTFGASAKTFIPGLRDVTFSVGGKFDPTLDAHLNGVLAAQAAGTLATASYVIGPAGSTSGFPKYTGECLITSYQVNPPVGDVITWSAEFQGTGTPTRTTY